MRGELEARLLTDEPVEQVAGRVGLPAPAVEAYGEVFFSVRPMRRAIDWLLARAVGFRAFQGFTSPLPWAAWKLAAVAGGPLFLDVVIAATTGRPLPDGCHKGSGRERVYKDALTRLRVRLWVALMAAATDEEYAAVVRARRRLRALDARLTGRVTAVSPSLAAAEAFLMALPAMKRRAGVTDRRGEEADAVLLDVCRLAEEADTAGAGQDAQPDSPTTRTGKAAGSPRTAAPPGAGARNATRVA